MVNPTARRTAAYAIVFLLLFLSIGMVSASHPGTPGGGDLDGWVDAHGDTMYGNLNMGNNDIIINNRVLDSTPGLLRWNGNYVCLANLAVSGCSGGGDITSVTAGFGLTGGGASGAVTLAVDQGAVWTLDGNAGTDAGTDFLGTTDNVPLVLKVDGQQALRLEPALTPNVIGGHALNEVVDGEVGATISGGGESPSGGFSWANRVTGDYGTIGGGSKNVAGFRAMVGGGFGNNAANYATIAGGDSNDATGTGSVVGGGVNNKALGHWSTVPGGRGNLAAGENSFAAGDLAKADHDSAFVWADGSDIAFHSTQADQWRVRAAGGVQFYTNSAATTGCKLNPGSGTWVCSSDRDLKENWREVDGREVLDRLVDVPIATWNYKSQDPKIQHMGPAAQDMYAAFGLGVDETGISQVDGDGVAFAAIQGLWQELQEERARNDALEASNAALGARITALEARFAGEDGSY